jgi:hypothetical protein
MQCDGNKQGGGFKKIRYSLLVSFIICVQTFSLRAQNKALGSWNILNGKLSLSEKWSVFGEAQIRSLKFYDHFHYHEVKGGVNYEMNSSLRFTIGGGSYQTYREGGDFVLPKNNDEIRIWPQLMLSQKLGRLKIEQRYRWECRFTSSGYRNRYRYRVGLSIPLHRFSNDVGISLIANNELFFTDSEPYFERNRVMGGLQFQFNPSTGIQLAYFHQLDYRINDEIGREFLVVGCYFEFMKNNQQDDAQKD